jgi:hypothetical protein
VKHGHATLKVVIERLEILGEASKFTWIDNGLSHGTDSFESGVAAGRCRRLGNAMGKGKTIVYLETNLT